MGHLHGARSRSCTCCPTTSTASTRSSSAAARATSRRGWRGAARGRSGSTTPQRQLATARALQEEFGIEFPLVHGNAEADAVRRRELRLRDLRVRREHLVRSRTSGSRRRRGCCARAGGSCSSSTRRWRSCARPQAEDEPAGERLLRPYFGMHRVEWPGDDSVEFHLPHGELIALLRKSGFEIEELLEVRPARGRHDALSRTPRSSGRGNGPTRRSGRSASAADRLGGAAFGAAVGGCGSAGVRSARNCIDEGVSRWGGDARSRGWVAPRRRLGERAVSNSSRGPRGIRHTPPLDGRRPRPKGRHRADPHPHRCRRPRERRGERGAKPASQPAPSSPRTRSVSARIAAAASSPSRRSFSAARPRERSVSRSPNACAFFSSAKAERPAGDLDVLGAVVDEHEEAPVRRPALVQLAGRVQVARPVAERRRRLRRVADRGAQLGHRGVDRRPLAP